MNKWLFKNEWLLKPLLRFDTHFFKVCNISIFEVWDIIRPKRDREGRMKLLLYLIGTVTTVVTLTGMLLGFMRAYHRYDLPQGKPPLLSPLTRHTKAGLIIGGIMIWVLIFLGLVIAVSLISLDIMSAKTLLVYMAINGVLMFLAMLSFNAKRYKLARDYAESVRHGSARLGDYDDVKEYAEETEGIYIGGGLRFNDRGHLLTIGSTRSGKGTNFVIPNMLDVDKYRGSWVVIDPKGESAAISARYQEARGKSVYVLNPWDLLSGKVPKSASYNPFSLLTDKYGPHLVDDASIVAEMLVPIDRLERDKFFTDAARNIIAGLITYIAFTKDDEERNLNTLYEIIRKSDKEWVDIICDMRACQIDGPNGKIIALMGEEILKVMQSGDKTYGTILATMLQATDFIKSPALQKSFKDGFNPADLKKGNTIVYVVIPADKLSSHSRWLRLVIMTLMRSVVRNPNKDNPCCFLLDEFAALGFLSEIETALGTYAGYGVTIWPVLQSLSQLKAIYKDNWEGFIANSTVRMFTSINDNFSSQYVSEAIGSMTNVLTKPKRRRDDSEDGYDTNKRPLMAPDEIRKASGKSIITFIGDKPPLIYSKSPYYLMPDYHPDGNPIYDPNPYIV